MSTIRITKDFRFEGAHALLHYDGKCRFIHGHSYQLQITIQGAPSVTKTDPKNGMIMDFGDLKALVTRYVLDPLDHALLLRKDAPLARELQEAYGNVLLLDFQPTSEHLTDYIAQQLAAHLPAHVQLYSVRLYETPTSYAQWTRE